MAKYMIHACNSRLWYVQEYLVPSMLNQGIEQDDIILYVDENSVGNLASCINSFLALPDDSKGVWHLQDDVIISRDFKERTELLDYGLVCGFCCEYDVKRQNDGVVRVVDMWYSFPCIRIPNALAREFAWWYRKELLANNFEIKYMADKNKNDDLLFKYYLERSHMANVALCVNPNLVDHIDYLIGGSLVNKTRDKIVRSSCFKDQDLVEDLKNKLENND